MHFLYRMQFAASNIKIHIYIHKQSIRIGFFQFNTNSNSLKPVCVHNAKGPQRNLSWEYNFRLLGPFLLTWFNFNPSMDK